MRNLAAWTRKERERKTINTGSNEDSTFFNGNITFVVWERTDGRNENRKKARACSVNGRIDVAYTASENNNMAIDCSVFTAKIATLFRLHRRVLLPILPRVVRHKLRAPKVRTRKRKTIRAQRRRSLTELTCSFFPDNFTAVVVATCTKCIAPCRIMSYATKSLVFP